MWENTSDSSLVVPSSWRVELNTIQPSGEGFEMERTTVLNLMSWLRLHEKRASV